MKDVQRSLDRAMIEQGWLFQGSRIGDPFEWVDGHLPPASTIKRYEDVVAVVRWLTATNEVYPTPEQIKTSDFDTVLDYLEQTIKSGYEYFAPFRSASDLSATALTAMALTRTQDYGIIKTFCKDLPEQNINYLDFGPGLGGHAMYSLRFLGATYYGVEAIPYTYGVQRYFFRFLSSRPGDYLDVVECENFQLSDQAIHQELNNNPKYRIKHVPSWRLPMLNDRSIDIVTATFMLNEVSTAGALWILSQASRLVRSGGYVYIRDSGKLKPGRHSIDYDSLLPKMGFAESGRLNIQHRVDMFGVPRVFQKETDRAYSFEELCESCLGHFFVRALDNEPIEPQKVELDGKTSV